MLDCHQNRILCSKKTILRRCVSPREGANTAFRHAVCKRSRIRMLTFGNSADKQSGVQINVFGTSVQAVSEVYLHIIRQKCRISAVACCYKMLLCCHATGLYHPFLPQSCLILSYLLSIIHHLHTLVRPKRRSMHCVSNISVQVDTNQFLESTADVLRYIPGVKVTLKSRYRSCWCW